MATLTIRNLDDDLKSALRMQAARHGQSMEEEVRSILRQALSRPNLATGLGQRLTNRFRIVASELAIPPRSSARRRLGCVCMICWIPTSCPSSCGQHRLPWW